MTHQKVNQKCFSETANKETIVSTDITTAVNNILLYLYMFKEQFNNDLTAQGQLYFNLFLIRFLNALFDTEKKLLR